MPTKKVRNKRWVKAFLGTLIFFMIMIILGWATAFFMGLLDIVIDF